MYIDGCEKNQAIPEKSVINKSTLLLFTLDGQSYALPLADVERVIRAAAPTPLPRAPEIVLGILDLGGDIIPVVNIRRRFRLQERAIRPEDHFIVARAGSLKLAMAVDESRGVIEPDREPTPPEEIVAGTEYVAGVTRMEGNLVLIHDLAAFLSLEEADALAEALGNHRHG